MPDRTIVLTAQEDALLVGVATMRGTTPEAVISQVLRDRLNGFLEERRARAAERVASQWATLTEAQRRNIETVIA